MLIVTLCAAVALLGAAGTVHASPSAEVKLQNEPLAHNTASEPELKLEKESLGADLGNLQKDAGLKVAFSASLPGGYENEVWVGPGDVQTIVFRNVFINSGNAYNPATGVFTAPRKGAYQFTFTTWGYESYKSGARLVKNGHVQVGTWQTKGWNGSTSGAVILSLNAGDRVNVVTWGHDFQVYDGQQYHLTTFSGFLLFPL